MVGDTADDFAGGMIYNNSGDYLRFDSDNAERLRITGANFMFNQTDSNPLATLKLRAVMLSVLIVIMVM